MAKATWRQDWSRTVEECCCLPVCLACFLIYSRTTYPGVPPPIVAWNLPHQSLIKKIPHSIFYRPVQWRYFPVEISSSQIAIACVKLTTKYVNQQPPNELAQCVSSGVFQVLWILAFAFLIVKVEKQKVLILMRSGLSVSFSISCIFYVK